ncbi:MAG: hypothetical protein ACREVI_07665 [Steroidobacteraceae bacterium]
MNQVRTHGARAVLAGSAILLALALLAPAAAQAQAWLPEKGSTSFALAYSEVLHKKHYVNTGGEVDVGHTSSEITNVSGSYSPSDRWMIQASIPYVNARYKGAFPHPSVVDDGSWHATLTDLVVTAHYQAVDGWIGLAPYAGVVIPTHDYVVIGHGAPGRGLEEYWLGFYTATSLNEWIPRTYVELRANYAFVEEVANVFHNRSNAGLELGYYLNESWSVRLLAAKQWTHGGVGIPIPATDPLFPFHDQLAEDEFVNVGAGISRIMNDRLQFYGLYMESIDGRNSHKVDHRVSFGMSYGTGHGN